VSEREREREETEREREREETERERERRRRSGVSVLFICSSVYHCCNASARREKSPFVESAVDAAEMGVMGVVGAAAAVTLDPNTDGGSDLEKVRVLFVLDTGDAPSEVSVSCKSGSALLARRGEMGGGRAGEAGVGRVDQVARNGTRCRSATSVNDE
jgi:hypothetical protein